MIRKILVLCFIAFYGAAFAQKEPVKLIIDLKTGPSHINPSFVVWLEDSVGNYLRTVFVTQAVAQGVYPMAKKVDEDWQVGNLCIEGALPVWAHRRGIKNKNGGYTPTPETPVPDAYSGATPIEDSRFYLKIDKKQLPKFRVLFEINQSHDFNDYFTEETNEQQNLQCVGQPSVVYGKLIDLTGGQKMFKLLPLGYGDTSGASGKLYRGFDKFDTALWLVEDISIKIRN